MVVPPNNINVNVLFINYLTFISVIKLIAQIAQIYFLAMYKFMTFVNIFTYSVTNISSVKIYLSVYQTDILKKLIVKKITKLKI